MNYETIFRFLHYESAQPSYRRSSQSFCCHFPGQGRFKADSLKIRQHIAESQAASRWVAVADLTIES